MSEIRESSINIISEGTDLIGRIVFDQITRVHGSIKGEVSTKPGGTLILGETGMIEGNIDAETIMIDGYVKGDIVARTRLVISGTGRVVGNVRSPSLEIQAGAYFEGETLME